MTKHFTISATAADGTGAHVDLWAAEWDRVRSGELSMDDFITRVVRPGLVLLRGLQASK